MKRTISFEIDNIESSTETESRVLKTLSGISNHKAQNSPSVCVTSHEVVRLTRAATNPLTQQLGHFCELMRELKNEQANRRHEDITSFRAAGSTSAAAAGLTFVVINCQILIVSFWNKINVNDLQKFKILI